jgi:hypothetical protein
MMKTLRLLPFFSISILLGSFVYAQESGAKQVDEAIVRVISGIVLRSTFESELRESIAELKRRGFKGEELVKRFNEWKPLVLDQLINRLLLVQQATALSIDVRPEVDRLLLQIMMENDCESIECLKRKMREVSFDLDDVRYIITENLFLTLPPLKATNGGLVWDSRFTRFPIGNHPRSECPSLLYIRGVMVTVHN